MKTRRISVLVVLLASVPYAKGQVTIPSSIDKQIDNLVQTPRRIYRLDFAAATKNLDHIDTFFATQLPLDKAPPQKSGKDQRTTFRLPTDIARPIMLRRAAAKMNWIPAGGSVTYVKEAQSRTFIKEVRVPARSSIPDVELIRMTRSFVTENGLSFGSTVDRLGTATVLTRKRTEVVPDGTTGRTEVLFQRVQFRREVGGLEVLNSKQIVDVQPDGLELVAYKSIRWIPLDEASGAPAKYVPRSKIIERLNRLVAPGTARRVEKAKLAYYQTDKALVPVLAFHLNQTQQPSGGRPIREIAIVPLIDDAELMPRQATNKARPANAPEPH